jgi:hypothetical protein
VEEEVSKGAGDPYLPKAKTVEHGTPPALATRLATAWADGAFDLDVAASDLLHVADRYYTVRVDGLTQPWEGKCFCNPPYGEVEEAWVRKGRQEVLDGRASIVVYLLPAKTGKKWWQRFVATTESEPGSYRLRYPVESIEFLPGRVQHVGSESGATFPSVVLVMRDYNGTGWGDEDRPVDADHQLYLF